MLYEHRRYTDSDYTFGIFWPLCCMSIVDIRILITPLVSSGHYVVWASSIYGFWLHLWYLLAIMLYEHRRFTDSNYTFGIFLPLCCMSIVDIQILIIPLVSSGHYVVWASSIYGFWLHLWYLLAIMLYEHRRFTDSDYTFGIFLPLCCMSIVDIQILIIPLVSSGHYVVWASSIYGFWLHLWYLLAIMLYEHRRYTDSDYTFGIFWPLCCMSIVDIQILITPLVSSAHYVVWASSIYRFWLHLWYLLAIMLYEHRRYTDSDYTFGIFWPLCCMSIVDIRILITPLLSSDHYVVWASSIYGFWLHLWYLLAIMLYEHRRYTDSDYTFGIFWPLCCMSIVEIRILITPLVSSGHYVVWASSIYGFWLHLWYLLPIMLYEHRRYTDSDYTFGIFWPLCCMSIVDIRILITPLVSSGHYVVWASSIYGFWLHLWYLLAIMLYEHRRYTDSDYTFGIFWPLCCMSIVDIRILITPLVSSCHYVVWASSIYGFWLHLWYLLAIMLYEHRRYTDSDYTFGIFWPLCCMSIVDIRILITPLVSSGHYVVWASSIYGFWLHLWYLLAIMLYEHRRYTDSDYTFGIFLPLCCMSIVDIQILITPLVSSAHYVVWASSIYGFWLHLWYLLAIMLYEHRRYTDSDYTFGIFWPLCCMSIVDIRILITPLVSSGHYVVWASSIYRFSLHLWYLLAIMLYEHRRYTDSDYTFGIFWPLCCMSIVDIRILITPLVSSCHYVVWASSIYGFWLHLWYLLAIMLYEHRRYTDSDYTFGIFWPLCCMIIVDIRILITPLVSSGHYVVWASSIYGFWLHLWYLQTIFVRE